MSPEEVAKLLKERLAAAKKEKLPEQKCIQCLGPFTPRRAWQRFCSNACANYHSNNSRKVEFGLLLKKAFDLEKQVQQLQAENISLKQQVEKLK